MIRIDGSAGGGAMLRMSLGFSLLTGKPFEIVNIRASRPKPGLSWQHLHALNAAHQMSNAEVVGNTLGATTVVFKPNKLEKTTIEADIGTAGSVTLFLQTFILPALFSGKKFSLTVKGGTDVQWSIPSDYFAQVLVPQLREYATVSYKVKKRGYYPKGGGEVVFVCEGKTHQPKVDLTERGELLKVAGISHAAADLQGVAERQAQAARVYLKGVQVQTQYSKTSCYGSGITLWAVFGKENIGQIILGADCLGEKKVRAEEVGKTAALALSDLMRSDACCDEFLADQLIPVLAVVGGALKAKKITDHTLHNIAVAEKFMDVKFTINGTMIVA